MEENLDPENKIKEQKSVNPGRYVSIEQGLVSYKVAIHRYLKDIYGKYSNSFKTSIKRPLKLVLTKT